MASAQDHNISPVPQLAHNPDHALEASHQHTHGHTHHSPNAVHDETSHVVYTTGTTDEKPSALLTPSAQDSHLQHRHNATHDVEKTGGIAYDDKGTGSASTPETEDEKKAWYSPSVLYRRFRLPVHIFIGCFFTGWWIASVVVHRKDKNWIIPFLFWLAIMIRLITLHIPVTIVTKPMHWIWSQTGVRVANLIPEKLRVAAGAGLTIVVIIIGSFVSAESEDNTRANRAVSLFGLVVFIAGFWATSRNRKKIVWHTVIVGMLIQFIIALFVLRTKAGYDIFNFISQLARLLLGFANNGVIFLTDATVPKLPWFFTGVIPAIIFFVSFVQLLYYWGVLQWFIGKFAVFFFWAMRVSGAEAVVASASPFIGQGESAMLIRPFVPHLTMAELHQVMCSGFATIAGSVLVAYISMGLNPQALISSCVMSIPASLAFSKLRYPEEEESLTAGRVVIPDDEEHKASNALHAFANGAWLGLKIAGMIVATLLCIIALLNMVDGLLTWWGRYINLDGEYDLTLELILGYVFYPVAFLLGVSRQGKDLLLVGRLIGIKVITNEFVAFSQLVAKDDPTSPYHTLSPRSRVIATYALCGFGNIGSLGTQIGVLSQISPGRSGDVSRLALSSLVAGVFSTLSSASVAGLVIVDQGKFTSGS